LGVVLSGTYADLDQEGKVIYTAKNKKRQARFFPPPYKVRGRLWNDWPPCELFKVCVHIPIP
jgi:hypothetical protein